MTPPPPAWPQRPRATIADLAVPAGGRWTAARKADVLQALDRGDVTQAQVLAGLGLSLEELASWRRRFRRHAVAGLRETRVQEYRR